MLRPDGPPVALTGATGFLGAALLEALVARHIPVRALTRKPQPVRPGVDWIPGDLLDSAALDTLMHGCGVVFHVAGLIKARSREAFWRGNVQGTKAMIDAALRCGAMRFIHVSTLAAREPSLSHYSASKATAEKLVRNRPIDWTIIRPPGIYGPGDRETLSLFKMARGLMMPIPSGDRFAAWIHRDDAADALITATHADMIGYTSEIDDGSGGYSLRSFAQAVRSAAKGRAPILAVPDAAVKLLGAFGDMGAALSGKAVMLTSAKAREILHEDWRVNKNNLTELTGWKAKITLTDGLESTARWYMDADWL